MTDKEKVEEIPKEEPTQEVAQATKKPVEDIQPMDEKPEQAKEFSEHQLVPTDVYLKSGIHVGTKFKTKHMAKFIYKTRPDGLSVLDVEQIDERIRLSINLLKQYEPEEILIVSRRENGWKPVTLLSKMTGIKSFAGRYPPGILTNSNLENFVEAKVIVIVDAWADKNAIEDALKIGIPVISLCDTNNLTNNIDLVVPCNNKGRKSLGLYFYLVAREFMLAKGLAQKEGDMKYKLDDFLED